MTTLLKMETWEGKKKYAKGKGRGQGGSMRPQGGELATGHAGRTAAGGEGAREGGERVIAI